MVYAETITDGPEFAKSQWGQRYYRLKKMPVYVDIASIA